MPCTLRINFFISDLIFWFPVLNVIYVYMFHTFTLLVLILQFHFWGRMYVCVCLLLLFLESGYPVTAGWSFCFGEGEMMEGRELLVLDEWLDG